MLVHFQLFEPQYIADTVAATRRRYHDIHVWSHLLPDRHQRHLLTTETFHLHIRFRDFTTQSIFVMEKNVFRSNLFSKQRNSPPQACQGAGRTTFLPLLSGN